MRKLFVACSFACAVSMMFACSAQPRELAQQASESVKACPYLVPSCPSDCDLVGGCPQQCECDSGKTTLCGTQVCGKEAYCCTSTTAGDECLPIGFTCPI